MESSSIDATNEGIDSARKAVLVQSTPLNDGIEVKGPDFNEPQTIQSIVSRMASVGFQATNLSRAVNIINEMLGDVSDEPADSSDDSEDDEVSAENTPKKTTIFLGCTSNMISSGLRETFRFLMQHKKIHCMVTTAGGIEEDLIKCLAPTLVGSFDLKGKTLRAQGLNRVGNLLIPNDNYCKFEDFIIPIFDEMLQEQQEKGYTWTPSRIIYRLGQKINNEDSILYWAAKNDIPIFCPALTDGSLGDMLFFHSYKSPGLIVDINADIRRINDIAIHAQRTGMIILGGGLIKHHIANANLMRNGADLSVYINTAQEFDGSDSGARPDEAVSWGKIRKNAKSVKVYAEATIVWPLIMATTFAKDIH